MAPAKTDANDLSGRSSSAVLSAPFTMYELSVEPRCMPYSTSNLRRSWQTHRTICTPSARAEMCTCEADFASPVGARAVLCSVSCSVDTRAGRGGRARGDARGLARFPAVAVRRDAAPSENDDEAAASEAGISYARLCDLI